MQLDKILNSLSIPHKETIYRTPPKGTYLVWQDSVERYGSDQENAISHHSLVFELISTDKPDKTAESELIKTLDGVPLEWSCGAWLWIQTLKAYRKPFYFDYLEKEQL